MEDSEYALIYQQLQNVLELTGFDWVVEQVREQIDEGKLVNTRAAVYRDKDVNRNTTALGNDIKPEFTNNNAEFVGVEDYTPKEQVLILLDAIEAIADAIDMREEIAKSLLAVDEANTAVKRVVIGSTEITVNEFYRRQQAADLLFPLIAQVRELVDDAN